MLSRSRAGDRVGFPRRAAVLRHLSTHPDADVARPRRWSPAVPDAAHVPYRAHVLVCAHLLLGAVGNGGTPRCPRRHSRLADYFDGGVPAWTAPRSNIEHRPGRVVDRRRG